MVQFCLMHVLHLGLLHFLNAASLMLLHEHAWFGPPTMSIKDMLEILTLRFRRWCSVQGIRPCKWPCKLCLIIYNIAYTGMFQVDVFFGATLLYVYT